MKVDKYLKDGKVAVLYSPGFGAGWSTWADDDKGEWMIFDYTLVQYALDGASGDQVEEYIVRVWGEEEYFYTGGWCQIKIKWVDEGEAFIITEYDGSESIKFFNFNGYVA